jgi:hypothetical protein
MSWVVQKYRYSRIAWGIDSSVRLVTKDAWPWKVIAALVMICTFGGIPYRTFLEKYATTIGPIQGYPRSWSKLSTRLLIHEARHTRQSRWFGLGIHPWLGLPIFGLLYLLVFLPLGFAYCRWRFEIDADLAAYRWALRNGYEPDWVRDRAKRFGAQVCSGHYGWSWIIGGTRGFEKAAEKAIHEAASER